MAGLEERFEEPEEAVEIQVLNEDFSILSFQEPLERADSAWLEAALQSGGGVLQVSGRTVCAVRDDLAVKRVPCQAHTVDSGWTSLRVSAQDLPLSALVAVAYLGPCLARSGLPWRQAGEALLVRKRDLPLATAMWVQAGHLVWPLSALTSPSPSSEPGLEVPGHGVWRLEKIEAPVGVVQELFSGSEGAIRIQSRCGFYAEVRPSEEASCCGRCTALPAAPGVGPGVVVSKSLVNFQPPRAGFWYAESGVEVIWNLRPEQEALTLPRHFVRAHDEAMEVIHSLASLRGSVLSRSAERWRRLEGEKAVVLELADDTAKRVGLWLFCGRYFTRVLGHEGVVSSCCCASLGRLKRMRGHVVEDDLRRYEALEGEVEAKGELRITRDVWRQSEGVVLFSSERSSAQLKRSGGQASLLLCLPSGVEEWKVHRWEFDPFDVEEEVQAPRSVRPEPPRKVAKVAKVAFKAPSKEEQAAQAAKASKFASAVAAAAKAVAAATERPPSSEAPQLPQLPVFSSEGEPAELAGRTRAAAASAGTAATASAEAAQEPAAQVPAQTEAPLSATQAEQLEQLRQILSGQVSASTGSAEKPLPPWKRPTATQNAPSDGDAKTERHMRDATSLRCDVHEEMEYTDLEPGLQLPGETKAVSRA
ncbi:unnamed protein product [Durusdinium trenchii]|uniref:Uncharacterized protein n=1 Tax=Durusdinium trenchii TaxID=1381693 RepID=A0ABP0I3U1_9DINO